MLDALNAIHGHDYQARRFKERYALSTATDGTPASLAEPRPSAAHLHTPHYLAILLSVGILVFLLFDFGPYISGGAADLISHFSLVDEIMKHGTVRLPPAPNVGDMAYYPPVSHWMAAIIGWIGGSGLVGLNMVTVASVYINYLLIAYLVGASSLVRVSLYAIVFYALRFTASQIGWEVVGNFFFPQLVADIAYFAVLLFASKTDQDWKRALVFILAGAVTMWAQPLIAVHILATGIVLMAFRFLETRKVGGSFDSRAALLVLAIAVLSLAVVMLHPAFKMMRTIAQNDGWLEFGYKHINIVALICAALGVANLLRRLKGRASYVDAVLGSAVVAAVGLEMAQFAIFKLHGDGSAYAVKKHMFLIVTLGMMNAVRIAEPYLHKKARDVFVPERFVAPIMAGLASFVILQGYVLPLAPIVKALAFADEAVAFHHPNFVPGNTVDNDTSQPVFARIMITRTAFKYPVDKVQYTWFAGASMLEGASYAMVLRTPGISKQCTTRPAEGEIYVIVDLACLINYKLGTPLSVGVGGSGLLYARSGWTGAESWGNWSVGGSAGEILLTIPPGSHGPYTLVVDGMAYISKSHPKQVINVTVNGSRVASWIFDESAPSGERSAEIPDSLIKNNSVRIVFEAPDATSPNRAEGSPDARVLGLGVRTFTLQESH